ncbi:MAG: hypothetical protein ACRC6L_12940 [Steroidobacteraceae bacterium]
MSHEKAATETPVITLQTARTQAEAYGYKIEDDGIIVHPTGKDSMVRVDIKRSGRMYVRGRASGDVLWSGIELGDFLSSFWFAKKITPQGADTTEQHKGSAS